MQLLRAHLDGSDTLSMLCPKRAPRPPISHQPPSHLLDRGLPFKAGHGDVRGRTAEWTAAVIPPWQLTEVGSVLGIRSGGQCRRDYSRVVHRWAGLEVATLYRSGGWRVTTSPQSNKRLD